MDEDDLNTLKTDDFVAIFHHGYKHDVCKRVKIDRITKTQIIIGNSRFLKRDGYKIGDTLTYPSYIRCITPKIEKEIVEYNLKIKKENLINKIKNIKLDEFSIETLEEVLKILS